MYRLSCVFMNGAIILLLTALIFAFGGGGKLDLLGITSISIHNPYRIISILLVVVTARILLIPPVQIPWRKRINQTLDEIKTKYITLATTPENKLSFTGKFFRLSGLPIPSHGVALNSNRVLFSLFILWTLAVFTHATFNYLSYSNMVDLHIFIEGMDSAAKGNLFLNSFHYIQFNGIETYTVANDGAKASMFAMHFQPILYLFLPFYALFQSPITLLLFSSILMASGIWPVYHIARNIVRHDHHALIITLCYCFNPMVLRAGGAFIPSVFSAPLLLWGIWFAIENRYVYMTAMLILTLACKEIMALPVISFGLFLCFYRRKPVLGGLVCLVSIIYLYACLAWIMPHFISKSSDYRPAVQVLYPAFGSSLHEIISTIIFNPEKMLPFIFSATTIKYLLSMLWPLALIPVWGGHALLLCAPVLAQNLLLGAPGDRWERDALNHWSAPMIPYIFLATAYGIRFLKKHFSETALRDALLVMFFLTLFSATTSQRMLTQASNIIAQGEQYLKNHSKPGSSVSSNLVTTWGSLRLRHDLTVFPRGIGLADYIFISWTPQLAEMYAAKRAKRNEELPQKILPAGPGQPPPDIYLHYGSMYYDTVSNSSLYDKQWEEELDGDLYLTIFSKRQNAR